VLEYLKALVLGLVEGATEFIPVSSTGHLILAGDWLGFEGEFADTFSIVIQLGAILAVVWLYRVRLWKAVRGLGSERESRQLALNLAAAFVPAALVGVVAHDWIKAALFNPVTVACALVAGGFGILLIERWRGRARIGTVEEMRVRVALGIGLAQVASLIPGVSRSGATIMGALALGLSRSAAAEFSFFLAIPVMFAATLFELATAPQVLSAARLAVLAVGFATSFVSAVFVVRAFLRFVSLHTFTAFAWYRIVFGLVLLAWYLS
jgi:undecaprenyl-diphosphatase